MLLNIPIGRAATANTAQAAARPENFNEELKFRNRGAAIPP